MQRDYHELGQKGEALVATYLTHHGYTILAMNYTQKCGEIDIIARKADIFAFVEVKLRQHAYFSFSQVVTPSKQRKIIQTARRYIAENALVDSVFRFDIALLEYQGQDYHINHIQNAFTAPTNARRY